jgi:hypothetical protein
VRIPTFPRHSDADNDEPTTVATGSTTAPARPLTPPRNMRDDEPTLTDGRPVRDDRDAANRDANAPVGARERIDEKTPVDAGPKPRASVLATLGLILGVGAALLVLSGPLLGYGIGVAVLALIISLAGISATGKRHVAGRTDAVLGMLLALAAIVIGVLALTGSLSWLGTDTHPVDSARQWLDAQFVDRF